MTFYLHDVSFSSRGTGKEKKTNAVYKKLLTGFNNQVS